MIFLYCHLGLEPLVFVFKKLYFFLYPQCFTVSRHSICVYLMNKVPWWKQLIVSILIPKRLLNKGLISPLLYMMRFYSPHKM